MYSVTLPCFSRWLTSFKIHLEDTIDRLKKGQNIHGRVSKKPKASQSKTILKKPDGVS